MKLLKRATKSVTQDLRRVVFKAWDRQAKIVEGRASTVEEAKKELLKIREHAKKLVGERKAKLSRDLEVFDREIDYWGNQAKKFAGADYEEFRQQYESRPTKPRPRLIVRPVRVAVQEEKSDGA